VTWYDVTNRIVWLCAVTNHNYKEIERRALRGDLLPTLEDQADIVFFADRLRHESLLMAAETDSRELRAAAEANPDKPHKASLAGEIDVTVLIATIGETLSPADYYLVVHHPRARVRPLWPGGDNSGENERSVDDVVTILMFDEAEDAELDYPLTGPVELGPLRPGRDHLLRWKRL
jgi:hypothetical protein